MKKNSKFNFAPGERKAIAGLSSVISLRMLGLSFMIPVFSVYATNLPGATTLLAGVAFGIYGLTQAFLQIPFGFMSDKYGRRPVVAGGLFVFGVGSVIAAITTNIYILIAARFLQGAGAVASACFAWIADLTEESRRNTAMGFMGMSVGMGVVGGMVLGPILAAWWGVPFLFWLSAILSAVAITITLGFLKEPPVNQPHVSADFELNAKSTLSHALTPDLIKLDLVGFLVNSTMIATNFYVPLKLKETLSMGQLWKVYLPLTVLGGLTMMFSSMRADKGDPKKIIITALITLTAGFLVMSSSQGFWVVVAGFALFFAGFSVLEATLPAAVSKLANPAHRGSIIGVYNLSQFFGVFIGGALAGLLSSAHSGALFLIMAGAAASAAILVGAAKGVRPVAPEMVA
ncbi:MAG: MFS transporter [Nitrospinae bacterium]|nr:MFS transporter [Nitrospinota bacterium]